MSDSFYTYLAVAALLFWPAIPLFWIPVHLFPRFFRRLGFFTYILPLITWLPIACIIFRLLDVLLLYRIELPVVIKITGICLFILGAGVQVWTLYLLTLPVIMGMPEVTTRISGRLETAGPFAVVRHPTYLSHLLMLLGIFGFTGVTSLGVVAIVDAVVVNIVVIPLEEKELMRRFGKDYEAYCQKVPSRFVPLWRTR